MEPQYSRPPRAHGPHLITMTIQPSQQHSDNDRSSAALDCNLTSLCDHIQMEGFSSGSFSDIVVHAMGSTYHLHRLILSRSPYFRNMLHGPWKEASSPIVTLHVDDKNVNAEAIAMALAYLYGHHPKLDDNNAFRVLAVASFLDLQDLCAICTDFIILELWTSNFLAYQVFAESQDYGIHGERVRNACWGYLCQSGAMELKEVLPKLSSQTLHALLTSDELWIPSEEKRFELALYVCLAKSSFCNTEQSGHGSSCAEMGRSIHSDSSKAKGKNLIDSSNIKRLESDLGSVSLKDELEGHNKDHNLLVELVDDGADPKRGSADYRQQVQRVAYSQSNLEAVQFCNMKQTPSRSNSYTEMTENGTSCSCVEMPIGVGGSGHRPTKVAIEGLSEESLYHFNDNNWLSSEQSRHCPSLDSSCNRPMYNEWGRCSMPPLSWGGRVVGKREVKGYAKTNCMEDYDTFVNIFEGGSLLYCNMSFEALLNVRNHLEELGFPCKAVNDGLWLQMLLSQRVQEIGADTCKICCCTSMLCNCRQPWPPTRFVFSRVPFGMGNRNCQQSAANDDSENRNDHNGDMTRDGLTAVVGLTQGGSNTSNVHGEHIEQGYETDAQGYVKGPIAEPSTSGISVQMLESPENAIAIEWENTNGSFISLDMKTPLSHFPPFRFGVLFEDVHRLSDGQVKHSPEFFYAGSLWKVSVQAFNDEDPQGRRTLGLFLHRRKAEIIDSLRKVHMYVDSREKVTARYQLICPSKREVMVFGSYKQRGTLLPKAPKGWGWRTALLFDELAELLQNGTLRVAAIVQLV